MTLWFKWIWAASVRVSIDIMYFAIPKVGDPALEESHTRGLPSDHTGKV